MDCQAQAGDGELRPYTDSRMVVVTRQYSAGNSGPHEYYHYRAVYMDCVRAVDFAAGGEVNPGRIAVGTNQERGALGIAVCALDGRPALRNRQRAASSDLRADRRTARLFSAAAGIFSPLPGSDGSGIGNPQLF